MCKEKQRPIGPISERAENVSSTYHTIRMWEDDLGKGDIVMLRAELESGVGMSAFSQ